MGITRIKDAAVKVSEYTDAKGEKKGRWVNVGSLMKGDDGNTFLLLDRHFNPGGVWNPDGRTNVLISFFDLKEGGQQEQRAAEPAKRDAMNDEIPF